MKLISLDLAKPDWPRLESVRIDVAGATNKRRVAFHWFHQNGGHFKFELLAACDFLCVQFYLPGCKIIIFWLHFFFFFKK